MRRLDVSWTFHDLRAKADSDHETGLGLMRRHNRARRQIEFSDNTLKKFLEKMVPARGIEPRTY